jgi:hypothetical protein
MPSPTFCPASSNTAITILASDIGLTPQIVGLRPAFVDIKATTSVVRAGLNFRFGGWMAPAAVR